MNGEGATYTLESFLGIFEKHKHLRKSFRYITGRKHHDKEE